MYSPQITPFQPSNIDATTKMLMGLQQKGQLQQYVAQHKNDPNLVALALYVNNMSKARPAVQAEANQPKVVDRAIAEMAPQQMMPEDQGIGTLPAPNMQRFAGGGIVAFDEGGDVPGYAGGVFTGTPQVGQLGYEQLVRLYQTDPELAREAALRAGPTGQRFLAGLSTAVRAGAVPMMVGEVGIGLSAEANRNIKNLTPAQRKALYSNPMLSAMSNDAGLASAIQNAPDMEKPNMSYADQMGKVLSFIPKTLISAPADKDSPKGYGLTRLLASDEDNQPKASVTPYDSRTATRRADFAEKDSSSSRGQSSSEGAPQTSSKSKAGQKPPTTAKQPVAPADSMAGLPSLKTSAISAEQAKADAATLSDDVALRNALSANESFVTGAYDKLLGDYDRKIAEMPEAYKSYETRLKKEETEAETDKSKALGMSIFRAGLGMLAGTSQYAFENIGKGALAGLEDYQSALKDFKKAQRERDKAFADIEQARLAEKRGDLKTHTELQSKGIEALGAAKNRTVDGIAKIFEVDTRTATGIFETGMKELAQNERTIYSAGVELKKQGMSDKAALERTNAQVAGQLKVAQTSVDAYKTPMLYKAIEDSVDKMLQNDMNYKTADEATKNQMRNDALKKRLLATPGMAQFAQEAPGGGGSSDFVYQNGQLVPRKP